MNEIIERIMAKSPNFSFKQDDRSEDYVDSVLHISDIDNLQFEGLKLEEDEIEFLQNNITEVIVSGDFSSNVGIIERNINELNKITPSVSEITLIDKGNNSSQIKYGYTKEDKKLFANFGNLQDVEVYLNRELVKSWESKALKDQILQISNSSNNQMKLTFDEEDASSGINLYVNSKWFKGVEKSGYRDANGQVTPFSLKELSAFAAVSKAVLKIEYDSLDSYLEDIEKFCAIFKNVEILKIDSPQVMVDLSGIEFPRLQKLKVGSLTPESYDKLQNIETLDLRVYDPFVEGLENLAECCGKMNKLQNLSITQLGPLQKDYYSNSASSEEGYWKEFFDNLVKNKNQNLQALKIERYLILSETNGKATDYTGPCTVVINQETFDILSNNISYFDLGNISGFVVDYKEDICTEYKEDICTEYKEDIYTDYREDIYTDYREDIYIDYKEKQKDTSNKINTVVPTAALEQKEPTSDTDNIIYTAENPLHQTGETRTAENTVNNIPPQSSITRRSSQSFFSRFFYSTNGKG